MTWYHNDKIITQEDIQSEWVGFVYLITNQTNGMKYVGKKLFWTTRKRPPLKGAKRKRIDVIPSEWQKYYGSNDALKTLVEDSFDKSIFKREILHICFSKVQLSYYEAKEQFDREVLFDETYYNGFIGAKINARGLKKLNVS